MLINITKQPPPGIYIITSCNSPDPIRGHYLGERGKGLCNMVELPIYRRANSIATSCTRQYFRESGIQRPERWGVPIDKVSIVFREGPD